MIADGLGAPSRLASPSPARAKPRVRHGARRRLASDYPQIASLPLAKRAGTWRRLGNAGRRGVRLRAARAQRRVTNPEAPRFSRVAAGHAVGEPDTQSGQGG